MYFQLTDDEKFYSKPDLTLEETGNFAYENALDFIALGFKPEKTKIIINTKKFKLFIQLQQKLQKKLIFQIQKQHLVLLMKQISG